MADLEGVWGSTEAGLADIVPIIAILESRQVEKISSQKLGRVVALKGASTISMI